MQTRRLPVLSILVASLFPATSHAQWSANGATLSAGVNNQSRPRAASDGAGGMFVTWNDSRGGDLDIYAQHVNAQGAVQWVSDGVAVRSASNHQSEPRIVSDGAGGAIIVWVGNESGSNSIYGQRIDALGNAQWTINGVQICNAPQDQQYVDMIPDGSGGAILAWTDGRVSNLTTDIYAQRIDSGGVSQWLSDGVAVCTAASAQHSPVLTSDGAGGAIITWGDTRVDPASTDVYAQRVNSLGAMQWTADGVAISTAAKHQTNPWLTTDGAGGAIIVWVDSRDSYADENIYAQRVNAAGAVQWTANGLAVCTAAYNQNDPRIVADGSGGAILTWDDARADGLYVFVYAQRMNSAGAAEWTPDGMALCTTPSRGARLIGDDAGAAIVTWMDYRSGNSDIYTQRVSASGTPQWTPDGVALCTASNSQSLPTIVSDGAGGALVAWDDYRSGSTYDVYGNRVTLAGAIPTGIGDTPAASSIVLGEGYPNPFSAGTALDLALPREADVSLEVFDVAGRRVRAVELGRVAAGSTRLSFDGRDDAARALPSGVYFCRVHAAGETLTRKMVIQR